MVISEFASPCSSLQGPVGQAAPHVSLSACTHVCGGSAPENSAVCRMPCASSYPSHAELASAGVARLGLADARGASSPSRTQQDAEDASAAADAPPSTSAPAGSFGEDMDELLTMVLMQVGPACACSHVPTWMGPSTAWVAAGLPGCYADGHGS